MLAAFVAVTVSIVGALDYTLQTRKAGLAFGDLGLSAYVDTMGVRFNGMKAEQAAAAETGSLRRQEPRILLPETPEGWVMREWNEQDRARLFPSRELRPQGEDVPEEFEAFYDAMENDPQMRAMTEANERMQVAQEKREIRFYQRGDSLIALELSFQREASGISLNGQIGTGNIQASAMDIVAGNITAMSAREGFAVVGGVPFGRRLGLFGMADPDADPLTTVRVFRGQMGPELDISVRAMAPDQDVKDLLATIDFDTLNKLLTTPLEGVGSAAPAIATADEQAIATAAVEAQADAIIERGRQAEANMMDTARVVQEEDEAGFFGMLLRKSSEARAAAAEEAAAEADAAAAPPAEGSLAALMAGGAPEQAAGAEGAQPDAAAAAVVPATPPAEVRVRRAGVAGAENCTMTATGKRCSLIGD